MKINHFSITSTIQNDEPSKEKTGAPYCIQAELNDSPEANWKRNFQYIWYDTILFGKTKNEVVFTDNTIQFIVHESSDIQNAIESMKSTIDLTDNLTNSNVHPMPVFYKKTAYAGKNYLA